MKTESSSSEGSQPLFGTGCPAASAAFVLVEIILRSACMTTAMMPTTISFATGMLAATKRTLAF